VNLLSYGWEGFRVDRPESQAAGWLTGCWASPSEARERRDRPGAHGERQRQRDKTILRLGMEMKVQWEESQKTSRAAHARGAQGQPDVLSARTY
jgi:hypothetical protein